MDYNYESNGLNRDHFNSEGSSYQRSADITSQQRYNRVLGPHNVTVAGTRPNSRYNTLGGISNPTVAAAAPQTPNSSLSRPQFQTPFFHSGHSASPAMYSGGNGSNIPLELPGTPQSHYGQQYGFKAPLVPSSPKMAAMRSSTARYGMAGQMYSHYPEQMIAHESLEPVAQQIHARPSMHCEPPHYGMSPNRSFEHPDRRQPYLAQMQQYEEPVADCRPLTHEGDLRGDHPNRNYIDIEQMWKGIGKEEMMKDVPNRQYHDIGPIWNDADKNKYNVTLKDNPGHSLQYKESEAKWKVMDKIATPRDIPNRQHHESGAMRVGKHTIPSVPQSPGNEFPIKKEPYNHEQNNMNATKTITDEHLNPSPFLMMKAKLKSDTVQQAESLPQADNFRVLSGPLSQVIKWEKMIGEVPSLFEVIAPFVAVHSSSLKGDKMVILREKSCPALQCLFQEIDRPLPNFQPGQFVRCVGKMIAKNKMRAYSVRAAHSSEKSSLLRFQFVCNRGLQAAEGSDPSLV